MNEIPKYAWPVTIALIVLALIQLVKSDKVPITIPSRARPWVALTLGILGGAAAAIVAGRPLLEALITGITGGTGSIGLFELGNSVKAPSPPPPGPSDQERPTEPPAPPRPDLPQASRTLWITDPFLFGGPVKVAFGLLFALVAFGCGAVEKVQHVVQMSSEVIARAEPCLVIQYEAQQEDCLKLESVDEARACVARVKATWKPIVDALVELRTVRCEIEPAKCPASK